MKSNSSFRQTTAAVIAYAYALLFIYAAVSKYADFFNFRLQLGQSPLLSAFAAWIAVLVPLSEILIALMLLVPLFRFVGLFLAYAIMAMFTAYIYIILNYSSFVPCSCGGVLQDMSWDQHLVFNLAFLALAALAVMIMPARQIVNDNRIPS